MQSEQFGLEQWVIVMDLLRFISLRVAHQVLYPYHDIHMYEICTHRIVMQSIP